MTSSETSKRSLLRLACCSLLTVLASCAGSDEDSSSSARPTSFDANGDGRTDLLIETSSNFPWSFGIAGPGRIDESPIEQEFRFDSYSDANAIAVADANADGRDDVLVHFVAVDGFVEWRVLLSSGSNSTRAIDVSTVRVCDDARVLAFTDINGDGTADILYQQQADGVLTFYVLYSFGDSFSAPDRVSSFDVSFGRPQVIALEDVDGDGAADLVMDLQLGSNHSYLVRTFAEGFGSRPETSDGWRAPEELNQLEPSPDGVGEGGTETVRKVQALGVADVTGDGYSELVYSVRTQVTDTFRVSRTPGAVQFLTDQTTETSWFYLSLEEGPGGSRWGSTPTLIDTNSKLELEQETVALMDLDGDARIDLLTKSSEYDPESSQTRVRWIARLSRGDGAFERRVWFEDGVVRSNHPLFGEVVGTGDFNGDGRDDLLLDAGPAGRFFTRLYVLQSTGATFDPRDWEAWYRNEQSPVRILGLEKNGLTTSTNDTSALIAWAGMSDTPLYTRAEFGKLLETKGFDLKREEESGEADTLLPGECELIYDSFDSDDYSANFGTLACLEEIDVGGVATVELRQQLVYGGCDLANKGPTLGGSNCELGYFKGEYSVDVLGVTQTLTLEGPKVSSCGAVSAEFTCARVGATLASVSRAMMIGDSGIGAGLSIGVGAGGSIGIEDGVISGSIDLRGGLGITIEFSLDAQGSVNFIARHGTTGYIFLRDNAGDVVISAGEAVIDAVNAVNDTGGVIVEGIGEGVEYIAGEVEAIGEEVIGAVEDGIDAIVDFFGSLF
ncbi:MAG: FG-GAP and VCBS repeat-containing protein [Planctomycetota bacterium]